MAEAKNNERIDAFQEIKRLRKVFGFTIGILESSLTGGRKKS